MTVLVVALGGALGAVARYVASGWVQSLTDGSFPWGTFAVNVSGSFVLGFALIWLQASVSSVEARQFVAIGFLGSFTTFSSFSYETLALIRGGELWRAGGYALGSVVVGLVAVSVGVTLAMTVFPHTKA